MTGEFRTSKATRIFMYIGTPPLIALFAFLGFLALDPQSNIANVAWIFLPLSLVGIVGFTYGLIEVIKGRIIIDGHSVSYVTALGTRTLGFDEIKGFRVQGQVVRLDANLANKKPIKISQYTEKYDQIVEWLYNNFVELDALEASQEEEQILSDEKFGVSRQGNEYRLAEAKRISLYINIAGAGAGVWTWLYPHPYEIAAIVAMCVPPIALGVVFIYGGLIRFDDRKNSAYPSIAYGFGASGGGLFIRAILDFEILEYANLWIVVSLATVVIAALLVIGTKELKFKKGVEYITATGMILVALGYTFGTYVLANCMFDKSTPQVFTSEVIGKEISSGKVTTYYLTLAPWGPRTEEAQVTVAKEQYNVIEEGDAVDVYLMRGLFSTPWFYVSEQSGSKNRIEE